MKTAEGWVFGSYAGNIQTSMLCAHDRIGTTSDACQGDSGESRAAGRWRARGDDGYTPEPTPPKQSHKQRGFRL